MHILRTLLLGHALAYWWSPVAEFWARFYTCQNFFAELKDFFSRRAFPIPLLIESRLWEVTLKRYRTPDLNFPNLKRLAQEKPAKTMKALRLIWPRIKQALNNGESLGVIQRQVADAGITISYKLLQTYVGRLRREDQLKDDPKAKPTTEYASRESKVAVCESRRTTTKPIAFIVPNSAQPMWTDLTCWNCGLDILSCRCRTRNRVC